MESNSKKLSCSSKVLISGGYSVLKEGNIGIALYDVCKGS